MSGKDGLMDEEYCAIGDTHPDWCAHCRAKKAVAAGQEPVDERFIPNCNASIGQTSRAGTGPLSAQTSSGSAPVRGGEAGSAYDLSDGTTFVHIDEAMLRGKLGRGKGRDGKS